MPHNKITLAKLSIKLALQKLADKDWDKLNDPKLKDLLKEKLRQKSEPKGIPFPKGKGINEVRIDDRFPPKPKDTSKMTTEELADYEYEKEQKILQRMHEKAKHDRGILELNEEEVKPILKIMSFIKRVDLDHPYVKNAQIVIDSIFNGTSNRRGSSPGMMRKNKDGKTFFVISAAQLDLVISLFQSVNNILQKDSSKIDKTKDKFKSLLKTKKVVAPPTKPKPIHEITNFDDLNVDDLDFTNDLEMKKLTGE